ncbi:hypothetical protein SAMN05421788_108201 [Filimonas lacunae]|uniref:Uncharacterized protein n=1 Tax=Filimonas lacunae TaxID=477680 RepID=A0A173MDI2_9BACT|nr:hypothetical protein [Filimonas lacunae]BAV05653.1 hypothetical protein FLA_1664 [Filimonas lacunae]SIT29036.1 hypothetical protein SAMN05421788_108201 [Filimonas lacunae]
MNTFTRCLLTIAMAASILSCEKNVNADRLLRPGGAFAGTATLSGIITGNRTLSNDTLYLLSGKVFVTAGSLLTIEAGARIEGIKSTDSSQVATLIVLKGAQIDCNGTPAEPVVFTSHESVPAMGDWGGIVLLGKASPVTKNTSLKNIITDTSHHIAPALLKYGGNLPADNSGSISYTRIEYAGVPYKISPLTLCGTGSGTTLEYIEVACSKNNAFDFKGGNTSAHHLVALAPLREAFATSEDYNGSISYSLVAANNRPAFLATIDSSVKSSFRSITSVPHARPLFSNLTVVGLQNKTTLTGNWLYAGIFTRTLGYRLSNSLFLGYFTSITTSDSDYNIISVPPSTKTDVNDQVQLISPWDYADFRPATFSPAATGGKPGITTYRGAFDPEQFPWTGIWARFDY